MSIKVDLKDLAKVLRKDLAQVEQDIKDGIRDAANRGKTHLVAKTPVDTGQMKNSWKAGKDFIHNDAPHAGIVEKGARPHTVSAAGIESLTRWAERQLGLSSEEAKNVAWGVAHRLKKEGQEGKFIVEGAIPTLKKYMREEVERRLRRRVK